MTQSFADRFALQFDPNGFRRNVSGQDVIIHCHHYNSRIQHSIESATVIDGKSIIISAAEAAFGKQIRTALRDEPRETQFAVAAALYAHLGYGQLDFSRVEEGIITAPSSHFVAGWQAGFPAHKEPVCSLTQGYLQAAVAAVTGDVVHVHEEECAVAGAKECRFRIDPKRSTELASLAAAPSVIPLPSADEQYVRSESVDEQVILDALVAMPIHGNDEGLIPAFNVYLANTPADFYNLACIGFIEAMRKVGLEDVARDRLVRDAEYCGINTFRGIMSSPEWDALVGPMLQEPGDELFGLIAVSNALGWGNWHVAEYEYDESVTLVSGNGYEASGQLRLRGAAPRPACMMLTGVAAGVMALVHGEGTAADRIGQFASDETHCRACSDSDEHRCSFTARDAA